MSETDAVSSETSENEPAKPQQAQTATKVVICRLPPDIDRASFLTQIGDIPTFNFLFVLEADFSSPENSYSRAFLNFCSPNDVRPFKNRIDNFVFRDRKFVKYPVFVEITTFQKFKLSGNLLITRFMESDLIFQDYRKHIELSVEESEDKTIEDSLDNSTTPLLEFIKHQRAHRLTMWELHKDDYYVRPNRGYPAREFRRSKPPEYWNSERREFIPYGPGDQQYEFQNEAKRRERYERYRQRVRRRNEERERRRNAVLRAQNEELAKDASRKPKKYSERRLETKMMCELMRLKKEGVLEGEKLEENEIAAEIQDVMKLEREPIDVIQTQIWERKNEN